MSSDDAFLEAAASIGRLIVSDAVWLDGMCSWMGVAALDPAQPWRAEYRALEPNLYDGTAGVGLFLAQLAAVTGDASARRTAVGALRHAVARAPALPPHRRDGLHGGSLGIAWAAVRAAALLDEEEMHWSARSPVVVMRPPSPPNRSPDVVLGSAGAIVALLALADAFDDPLLAEAAFATGEELIARATVTRFGWSWATPGRGDRHHLCGVSHGASGIAWAMLELFISSGDQRFRTAAEGAFAYERSWLDRECGTLPDLRIGGQRRGAGQRIVSPAVGTWCHGEGGIALTRLSAMRVLPREVYEREAAVALETTRRHLAGASADEVRDLSLCHGAAGSADVLLCGAAILGERSGGAADLAVELGGVMLERYGGASRDWPCDSATGTTPSLFRGLSGIAWWFLRLHDREIASPLMLPSTVDSDARARVGSPDRSAPIFQ